MPFQQQNCEPNLKWLTWTVGKTSTRSQNFLEIFVYNYPNLWMVSDCLLRQFSTSQGRPLDQPTWSSQYISMTNNQPTNNIAKMCDTLSALRIAQQHAYKKQNIHRRSELIYTAYTVNKIRHKLCYGVRYKCDVWSAQLQDCNTYYCQNALVGCRLWRRHCLYATMTQFRWWYIQISYFLSMLCIQTQRTSVVSTQCDRHGNINNTTAV